MYLSAKRLDTRLTQLSNMTKQWDVLDYLPAFAGGWQAVGGISPYNTLHEAAYFHLLTTMETETCASRARPPPPPPPKLQLALLFV